MKSKGLDQQLVIWFRNRKWLSTGYNGGRFYNALEIVRQQCPLVPDAVWLCSLFPLGTLWASPKAVFQQLPITDARSLVWKCNWETVIADMSYSCQRNLYEKYATEGYAFAQLGMLEVCKIRWDHSLSKADADELLKWAKLAAENGEPEAMFAYAQTCERDGLTAEERRYYHRAMVLGHGQAAFVYALGYTSILTDEYFHCLKIACKDGYTVAQKHVIDMSSPVAHQDQIKFRCGQLLSKFTGKKANVNVNALVCS